MSEFKVSKVYDAPNPSIFTIQWFRAPSLRPGWTVNDIRMDDLGAKVTPRARKVLDGLNRGPGHVCFSWRGSGVVEACNPRIPDNAWMIYGWADVTGPEKETLRFGIVNLPSAVPQTKLGDGNQPSQTGMDAPLLRAFGGSFFDLALTPGSSISINAGFSAGASVNFDAVRAQFARSFGNNLRKFFGLEDELPYPVQPPSAPPPTSDYVLYVEGEQFDAPAPGTSDEIKPGEPPPGKKGGADERYLPLIDSTLNKMSGQLARINEQLETLRGPWEDEEDTNRFKDWVELIANGLDLAGALMGITGAGATIAGKLADAIGAIGELNDLAEELGDVLDTLIDGGQDDLLEERWEKMADLFMYGGKSITQYIAEIRDAVVPEPGDSDSETEDSPLEDWKELLDTYFLEPEDEAPGNLFEALTTGPRLTVVARSANVYEA